MTEKIDLTKTVYELTCEHPRLIDVMAAMGFAEITKPAVRASVGKVMTIPKGAKVKGVPLDTVVAGLRDAGFEVVGYDGDEGAAAADASPAATDGAAEAHDPASRKEQIKAYLTRLNEGEALDSVRADFVRDFGQVDASEIMAAEQELLAEGTPLSEVQKLCDVHSALFHGRTASEIHRGAAGGDGGAAAPGATAGATPTNSHAKVHAAAAAGTDKAAELMATPGHPLNTFSRENKALQKLIAEYREAPSVELLARMREVGIHYAKKGDLLYPLLAVRYGITGPSEVMWTVDDEIRSKLAHAVSAAQEANPEDEATAFAQSKEVVARMEEMVYKEQNILFAICAQTFSGDEWAGIYRDAKEYGVCLGVVPSEWGEGERAGADAGMGSGECNRIPTGAIALGGGALTPEQVDAMLDTMPFEITFVDADDVNRYFNRGPKDFKRPRMALGRSVYSCHPPKVEKMVRGIVGSFRDGSADSVPVWMEKNGKPVLVTYYAVRDSSGRYLGTMELVQNMEHAREHFCGK